MHPINGIVGQPGQGGVCICGYVGGFNCWVLGGGVGEREVRFYVWALQVVESCWGGRGVFMWMWILIRMCSWS